MFGLRGASGLQVECLWVRGFGGFGRLLGSGLLGVSGLGLEVGMSGVDGLGFLGQGLRLGCRGLSAWDFWVRDSSACRGLRFWGIGRFRVYTYINR